MKNVAIKPAVITRIKELSNGTIYVIDTDDIETNYKAIIIDTKEIEFRVGEIEIKIENDKLMYNLKHTDKITINGITFKKEK